MIILFVQLVLYLINIFCVLNEINPKKIVIIIFFLLIIGWFRKVDYILHFFWTQN